MQLPYITIFVNDYIADTVRLKATANGAYWFLLLEYWRVRGSIPDDEAWLMETARVSRKEWSMVKDQVIGFFVKDDGRLIHPRMEKEIAKAKSKSDKARESAKERWGENANA